MIKRSVVVQGHATSVRLEKEFWAFIDHHCQENQLSLSQLIVSIEKQLEKPGNLASKLRVFCLNKAMKS